MTQSLIDALYRTGLVQFGLFEPGGRPVQANLTWLPSYPDVLAEGGRLLAHHIDTGAAERLLVLHDALPLGTASALACGVPMTYSLGTDRPGVHDIVGAYDIGHPTVLVINQWDPETALRVNGLVRKAATVGLDVQRIVALIDMAPQTSVKDIELQSVVRLDELARYLHAAGKLPMGQMRAIEDWLAHTP